MRTLAALSLLVAAIRPFVVASSAGGEVASASAARAVGDAGVTVALLS